MKTLNEQHKLIKEGKGHKGVFLKEAKAQFPQWIRNAATYKEVTTILKDKGIINENLVSLEPINQLTSPPKQSYEVAFENYLEEAKKKDKKEAEDAKAEEKEISKQVKDAESKNFYKKDMKNPDNVIFDQLMAGYYCEMKNPKNSSKTMEELKKLVLKNLEKNPIYYTEKGQFGEEGIGYETEVPGLGTPKEPKGPYKSSGYGTLKESHQPGDKVIYKGTRYEVVDEDEFIITLKDENGKIIKQNYNQFKKGEYKPNLQETKLRKVINTLIREELDESHSSLNKNYFSISKTSSHPNPSGLSVEEIEDYIQSNPTTLWGRELKMWNMVLSQKKEEKLSESINTMVRQQIKENVQKELQQINKDAEYEVLASKVERINAAIEKRQSQLDRLDEDEDLKNLTDKKKLKALAKDIKILEKTKAKMEKSLAKKDKSSKPQPEMIDEDEEIIDEDGVSGEIVNDFVEEDLIDEADGDSQDMEDMAANAKELSSEMDKISKMELFEEEPED